MIIKHNKPEISKTHTISATLSSDEFRFLLKSPDFFAYNMVEKVGRFSDKDTEGGADMATSSIFHNVKIDTPEKAEAFVAALEASEKEPWVRVSPERHVVETDPSVIKRIMEANKRNRETMK